ncbi:MAG: hypothetical protein K8I27_16265 [Planctomycetes bacterium]|nr:hypothetical protein [Planctomycetota bacterium]
MAREPKSLLSAFGSFAIAAGVLFLILALFVIVGLYQESVAKERLKPPEGATSIEELRNHLPPPDLVQRIEADSQVYTVWWIDYEGAQFFWLPSGPPVYVFDAQCELVMWSHETGDGGEVSQFVYSGTPVESSGP